MNKNLIILIGIVILGFGVFSLYKSKVTNEETQTIEVAPWVAPSVEVEINKSTDDKEVITNPTSVKEALEAAKTANKKLLLFFTMDNCKYCEKMKKDTLSDEDVKKSMSEYVFYTVDVNKERDASTTFMVSKVPAYMIVDPVTNKVIKSEVGYMSPNAFENWLDNNERWSLKGLFEKKKSKSMFSLKK